MIPYCQKKRLFDLLLSLLALLFLWPVFVIFALLIKLSSPGPIFFRQKRVGKNGRLFTIYKFRTMVRNATAQQARLQQLNEADGPVFKIKNDPRLTKIGAFLRQKGLDELPQLFNVLIGNMSLVGPRPLPPNEEKQIPASQRQIRRTAKPGIFSSWTASGAQHHSFSRWLEQDLEDIQAASLRRDLAIILKTIKSLLF